MGELLATVLGLLFICGSVSIFTSLIADKHYQKPMKENSLDDDAIDVILMDDVFDEAQE
jgi:hypothetical protein